MESPEKLTRRELFLKIPAVTKAGCITIMQIVKNILTGANSKELNPVPKADKDYQRLNAEN